MNHLYNTTSLCGTCYRHLPATVYEEDGKVFVAKSCPDHGASIHVIENDAEFFHKLKKTPADEYRWEITLIEVTDKCNLNCPHCYHLPDNRSVDRSIEDIVNQVKQLECNRIMFAGAEPTVRKDLLDVVKAVKDCGKNVFILTNGVKLQDEDFVKQLVEVGVSGVSIGLNHPDYQGSTVHRKQLQGIINCVKHKLKIEYIGYTVEAAYQLEYIVEEMQQLARAADQIRIRFGSDIGRAPDEPFRTLSNNYKDILDVAQQRGYDVEWLNGDDNIYHVMLQIGKAKVRLIQWPDVDNIVMEELMTGPWCNFYDGPVTNFVHQVITRDAFKNKKLPMLDTCPSKYHYVCSPDMTQK